MATAQPERPPIRGVAHIAFYVFDLEKARAFWTDFLGYQECFNLKRKDSDEVRIALTKINDNEYIELLAEKPRAGQVLNRASFYTDDAQAMRDYLESRNVKVPVKAGRGQTGNKIYNITDPDGNILELIEYQPDSWTTCDKGKFMPATRISDPIANVGVLVGNVQLAMDFSHRHSESEAGIQRLRQEANRAGWQESETPGQYFRSGWFTGRTHGTRHNRRQADAFFRSTGSGSLELKTEFAA